ncbi:MAG TPA: hypothetical protein VMV03_00130 [Spirochaetia bacterium]|nr:hypothetical protein [Spirochaetia bacterium]
MRNKSLAFIACAVVFAFAAAALGAQSWNRYSDSERKLLAQSYWLAGKQYQAAGKTDKGLDYMELAKVIDPQFDPSQITDQALPSAAELLARGGAAPVGAGSAGTPTQSLSSFFLRYVGSLLSEDAEGASAFFDGSVYVSRVPTEVTRDDVKTELAMFFQSNSMRGKEPSALYNLDSVVISPVAAPMRAAWGDAYTLNVDAGADYSAELNFWEAKQQFFVHRVAGDWSVFAVGRQAPPMTWKPKSAAAAAAAAPAGAMDAEASKAITEAFSNCMGALLKKDADGALAYVAQEIRFLRLRQSVTAAELKTSLQGSLENGDISTSELGDALDMDSVFIERAESPVSGVTGDVYSLSVQSKLNLSKAIPFWSSFQRYYFVNDGGTWKVFAIL